MGVSKVIYFGNSLLDLTNDTVTPETLVAGTTAHDAKGDLITGTMSTTLFAIISVTYPVGSICTCTMGSNVLTSPDTSGFALFNVKPGTYTVECHTSDNSQSKSTSVTVAESDKGKSVSVTLAYQTDYYNNGDNCTSVTGGWEATNNIHYTSSQNGTVIFGANNVTITPYYGTSTSMATVNKVNLASINTLYVDLDRYDDGAAAIGVHASSRNPDMYSGADGFAAYKSIPSNGTSQSSKYSGTVILDVSTLTGSYYIVIGSRGVDAGSSKLVVKRVWGD